MEQGRARARDRVSQEQQGTQRLQRLEEALAAVYYPAFGINADASATEVRAAGRRVSLECHPDKFPHNEQKATVLFQKMRQALEVLQDPKARAVYDQSLRQHRQQAGAAQHRRPEAGGEYCGFQVVSLERRYGWDPRELQ